MATFSVTRAHLKSACDQANWDLLDKLLEADASKIDDNALYTDTWGQWWGLLLETIRKDSADGVNVLLKHGAKRDAETWGDCEPTSALKMAEDKPAILALLQSAATPEYIRKTDPPLPEGTTAEVARVNAQGEVRASTGLVFQAEAFKRSDE